VNFCNQSPRGGTLPGHEQGEFLFRSLNPSQVAQEPSFASNPAPALKSATPREEWEPEMATIKGGCFQMGSPASEEERLDSERQHRVCVSDFAIGEHEVTFDEYDRFAEAANRELPDDEGWGRDKRPVINVTWDDAVAYARWLSEKTGKPYRLPTEAEWEYAARAGTTTPFSFGDNITPEQVNYNGNYPYAGGKEGQYREKTVPVKSLPPNPWGLYEMHGNVWEWCQDWLGDYPSQPVTDPVGPSTGVYRVLRGGSWIRDGRGVRSGASPPWQGGD
jgi:formylglycine-generating enzyme required for sulfatase activity